MLSTLQDDAMEMFSPPCGAHEEVWLARRLVGRLGDRMGLVSTGPPVGPPHGDSPQAAKTCVPGTPLRMVLLVAAVELETHAAAGARGSDGISHQTLGVLLPDHAHPIAGWPCICP